MASYSASYRGRSRRRYRGRYQSDIDPMPSRPNDCMQSRLAAPAAHIAQARAAHEGLRKASMSGVSAFGSCIEFNSLNARVHCNQSITCIPIT